MGVEFLFIPEFQVFEAAFLAREEGNLEHPCLKFFKSAWSYSVDAREKLIWISQELNSHLMEHKYKAEKKKRLALFSVVRVFEEQLGGEPYFCLVRLAHRLSIKQNKKIYFITDNTSIKQLIAPLLPIGAKIINSEDAHKIITKILK